MDATEVANTLDHLASWRRSFCIEDLLIFSDSYAELESLRETLSSDERFIPLGSASVAEGNFVPKTTLFRWFCRFTIRLAQAKALSLVKEAVLPQHQLALAMSSLRLHGSWDSPPPEAVRFGQQFGFVGLAWTPGLYVFPLARILSFIPLVRFGIDSTTLEDLADLRKEHPLPDDEITVVQVQEVLSNFDAQTTYVMQAREGLSLAGRQTLEQIGAKRGVTRQRIQQIEARFWDRLHKRPKLVYPCHTTSDSSCGI